jgi:hypothetical protein
VPARLPPLTSGPRLPPLTGGPRLPPLTGRPRLSAPDCPALSSLSLSRLLPSGAKLSAPVSSHAPLLSLLCGPVFLVVESLPRALVLSLSASWASPVSSTLPAPAVDQRARTRARRRNPQPRHPPTRPSSFLSPARARTHSPASFHAAPLLLALYPRCPTSSKTRVRLPSHPARRRPRQATPSSAPR